MRALGSTRVGPEPVAARKSVFTGGKPLKVIKPDPDVRSVVALAELGKFRVEVSTFGHRADERRQ
jgi:hypothetical protein